jgi:hypothetical protein
MYIPSPKLIFTKEGQALAHPNGGVRADEMQSFPPPKDRHNNIKSLRDVCFSLNQPLISANDWYIAILIHTITLTNI